MNGLLFYWFLFHLLFVRVEFYITGPFCCIPCVIKYTIKFLEHVYCMHLVPRIEFYYIARLFCYITFILLQTSTLIKYFYMHLDQVFLYAFSYACIHEWIVVFLFFIYYLY